MQAITLRPLSDGDSLDELTAMLRRAFFRLGQMGLNCTCVDQSVAVTHRRIEKGICYVAVCDGRLVGTFTLYGSGHGSESAWYRRQEVASIHQLGVDPDFQDRGLGTDMLRFAEGWARRHGHQELALDTPQPAEHLVGFYASCGYRPVESVRFAGKNYRSVILSKAVAEPDVAHANMPPLDVKRCFSPADTGAGPGLDAIARKLTVAEAGRITHG